MIANRQKVNPLTSLTIYPEKEEKDPSWLESLWNGWSASVSGTVSSRRSKMQLFIRLVEQEGDKLKPLSEALLPGLLLDLKKDLRQSGFSDELVSRSFALVRELAVITLGMRHYPPQLFGGLILLQGGVAEMETGEGKTLTATLAASTAALAGVPVHIVTVNEYLAQRDAEWMRPLYEKMGLTVGTVLHTMTAEEKQAAYGCDITYCTNKDVAFDYLRDRITLGSKPSRLRLQLERLHGDKSRIPRLMLRGLCYAIVDEADSVLVDESRTPLIISSGKDSAEEQEIYALTLAIARSLVGNQDYLVHLRDRYVELSKSGLAQAMQLATKAGIEWVGQRRVEELVTQGLTALHLFTLDKDYLLKDGKVQIVDEYTGRLMEDRSWERGLHQFIEIKEGCEMTGIRDTLARISYQRFFRRYQRLSGMTGTASEVAGEMGSVYGLRVIPVPTNKPLQRKYLPDTIFPTAAQKWAAVVRVVKDMHSQGRPVLVGTRSVADSEHLSRLLQQQGLEHEVLNARQDEVEAKIVEMAGGRGRITVATNMAGRGTDIALAAGVEELGGLHVIATERHDSGRVDRQLYGRCARQGQQGSCQSIVSLEDELLKLYGSKGMQRLAAMICTRDAVPFWLGRRLLRRAQRRAESLHARMRRDLLKMDKQLGTTLAFSGRQE